MRRSLPTLVLAVLAIAWLAPAASAQFIWSGTNGPLWSDNGNWFNGTAPTAPTLTDFVTFDNNSATNLATNNNIGALSFGTLQIGSGTGNPAGPVSISGGSLTLNNTTGIDMSLATVNLTVTAPLLTAGTQGWTINTGTTLSVTDVTLGGALTLNGDGNTVASGLVTGGFGITKAGLGALTLSGANNFTGGVTLSAGTLNVNSATALGTGALSIAAGTTIDNSSLAAVTLTNNNAVTVNGSFTFTGTQNLSFGTGAVALTVSPTITFTNASTLTVGAVTGAFGITKAGPGVLVLGGVASNGAAATPLNVNGGTVRLVSAANTFQGDINVSGATSVLEFNGTAAGTFTTTGPFGTRPAGTFKTITLTNGGTVRLLANNYNSNVPSTTNIAAGQIFSFGAGGGVIDVPSGSTFTIDDGSGVGIASTNAQLQGSGSLTKTGPGTLNLSTATANFSTYTGLIFVNAGFLQGGNGNAFGNNAQATTINGGTTAAPGGTLNINAVNLGAEPIIVNGVGVGGLGAIVNNNATAQTQALRFVTLNGDTTFGGTGRWDIRANTTATLNMGGFTLTKVGTGQIQLVGVTVSNPGNIIINAGTLGVEGGTALNGGAGVTLTVNTGGTFQQFTSTFAPTLSFVSNGNTTYNVPTGGGTTNSYAGPVTINAGTLTFNPAAATSITVSGNISGVGGLTKATAGSLILSGTNSYTGATTLTGGLLQFDSAASLIRFGRNLNVPNTAAVAFNYATAGNLQDAVTATVAGTSAGAVAVNAANANSAIDFSATGANLSNAFLTGLNGTTYTGNYTPSVANVLRIGGAGAGSFNYGNTITGTTSVIVGGGTAGAVVLTGANDYTGGTTITGSVANFTAASNFGTGPISFTGGTLQFANATADISTLPAVNLTSGTATFDTNGFSPTLANSIGNFGTGALTKIGTGNLGLNGVNTYTGATTVSAGSLLLGNADALRRTAVTNSVANGLTFAPGIGTFNIGSLAGASNIALADTSTAAVTLANGFNNTSTAYTGVMSGAGGMTKTGLGVLTLTVPQTYTGTTTVTGGQSPPAVASQGLLLSYTTALTTSNLLAPTSTLTFAGGSLDLLAFSGASTNSQTVAGVVVTAGQNYYRQRYNTTAGTTFAATLGPISRNTTAGRGTIDFNFSAATVTATAAGTPLVNGIIGPWATIGAAGANVGDATEWATLNGSNQIVPLSTVGGYTDIAGTGTTITSNAASNVRITAGATATTTSVAAAGTTDINTLLVAATNTGAASINFLPTGVNTTSILRVGNPGGILLAAGAGTLTIGNVVNNGVLTAGGAADTPGELILNTGIVSATGNGGTYTINSAITDNGAGAVTVVKAGYSQLTLAGTNTYTGGTFVNAGRVNVNTNLAALGPNTNATAVTIRNGGQVLITGGGTWNQSWNIAGTGTVEGTGFTFGAIRLDGGATLAGPITLAADASIGSSAGVGNATTLSGVISGPGALVRNLSNNVGSATLIVSNVNNSFTGGLVINGSTAGLAATVQLNNGLGTLGPVPTAANPVQGSVTLLNSGMIAPNFAGGAAGVLPRITPNSTGIIALTSATLGDNLDFSTLTGAGNLALGSLTGVTGTYTGTYTPFNNTYRLLSNAGTLTFNPNAFTGNRSLVIGGAVSGGTFVFGSNDYTGTTTFAGTDTVQFSALNAFGSNPNITSAGGQIRYATTYTGGDLSSIPVTLTGGTLQIDTNGNTITFANPIGGFGAGGIQKNGSGILNLNAVNVFTGTTTANGGTLNLNVANALFPSAALAVGNVSGASVVFNAGNVVVSQLSGGGTTGGTVDLNGNSLTFGSNNAAQTFGGAINNASTTAGSLTKVGAGTQTFQLRNSTSQNISALNIVNGTLIVDYTNTALVTNLFPATATLSLGGTATSGYLLNLTGSGILQFNGKATTASAQTFASTTLNQGGNRVAVNPGTATSVTVNLGAITRNSGATFDATPSAIGTITTPTANTGTTILGGWATANNGATFAVSAGNGTTPGAITGLATFNASYAAGGDVDNGTQTGIGGVATAVNSVRFNAAAATTVDLTGGLSVTTGGVLITPTVAANAVTLSNGTLSSGGAELFLQNYGVGSVLTINSQIIGSPKLVVKLGGTIGGANGSLVLTNAANQIGDIVINGSNNLPLAGTGNTVTITNSGATGSTTGTITLNQVSGLTLNGGVAISNPLNIGSTGNNNGGVFANGGTAGTATVNGPITFSGNAISNGSFAAGTGFTLQVNGFITANGLPINSRTGTVGFGGGGDYATFVIGAGTAFLSANNGLSPTATVDVGQSAAGILDLRGFNQTIAGLIKSGAFTELVTTTVGTSTLTINTPAPGLATIGSTTNLYTGNYTYSDAISGNLGLVKNGLGTQTLSGVISTTGQGITVNAGTLVLSGANTFTGPVTINGGTLRLGNIAALGSSSPATLTGGTVDTNGAGGMNFASITGGIITDSATTAGGSAISVASNTSGTFAGSINDGTVRRLSLTKDGTSTLTLTGANSYSGLTFITAGTLQLGNGGTTGAIASTSSVTNNGALTFNRSDAVAFTAPINGTGLVNHIGSGTTTLSAASNYTGGTTVSAGTLVVNNTTGSGTGSGAVTVGGVATTTLTVGLTAGSPAAVAGTVIVNNNGLVTGFGSTGGLTINTGGRLSPGASVGQLTATGPSAFNAGGAYTWELNSIPTGTAGTNWDHVNSLSTLTGSATAATPFTVTITPENGTTTVAGFDNTQSYTWTIATFAGGINTLTNSSFVAAPQNFSGANDLNGGAFSVLLTANTVAVVFTPAPVPEPATVLGIAAVGAGIAALRRRFRTAA